jgi:protein KTI12
MPLIVISGFPCSGKTTFANHLYDYLVDKVGVDAVHLVNEESENITKRSGYENSAQEKLSRLLGCCRTHA